MTMVHSDARESARGMVAAVLAEAAACFPQLMPSAELSTEALSARDARLAIAIHRTVLQRWMTLEYLLERCSRRPMQSIEPRLRGVLLSGAAQILFFDRLPVHAVVHESVNLAKQQVRSGAATLVNAVLRRLHDETQPAYTDEPWRPARDRLPLGAGSVVLRGELLPDIVKLVSYLSVATSHPCTLIERWLHRFGETQTIALCQHGQQKPPIIMAMEDGKLHSLNEAAARSLEPHAIDGFMVWRGEHQQLVEALAQHPARRVQDPASARAVEATAGLKPQWCLDYCAGRGTKTRQVVARHPQARVIATDQSNDRLADLQVALADCPSVQVSELKDLTHVCPQDGIDLLMFRRAVYQ